MESNTIATQYRVLINVPAFDLLFNCPLSLSNSNWLLSVRSLSWCLRSASLLLDSLNCSWKDSHSEIKPDNYIMNTTITPKVRSIQYYHFVII